MRTIYGPDGRTKLEVHTIDLHAGTVTVTKTADHPDGAGSVVLNMDAEDLATRRQAKLEDAALDKLKEIEADLGASLQKFWKDPAFARATGADFNFAAGEAVNLQPLVRMINEIRANSIKSSQATRIMIRRELRLAAEADDE